MAHYYIDTPNMLKVQNIQKKLSDLPVDQKQAVIKAMTKKFETIGTSPTSIFHSSFNNPTFFISHQIQSFSGLAQAILDHKIPDLSTFDENNFWHHCTLNRDRLWSYLIRLTHQAIKSAI